MKRTGKRGGCLVLPPLGGGGSGALAVLAVLLVSEARRLLVARFGVRPRAARLLLPMRLSELSRPSILNTGLGCGFRGAEDWGVVLEDGFT